MIRKAEQKIGEAEQKSREAISSRAEKQSIEKQRSRAGKHSREAERCALVHKHFQTQACAHCTHKYTFVFQYKQQVSHCRETELAPCPMEIYSHLNPSFLARRIISSEGSAPCVMIQTLYNVANTV